MFYRKLNLFILNFTRINHPRIIIYLITTEQLKNVLIERLAYIMGRQCNIVILIIIKSAR